MAKSAKDTASRTAVWVILILLMLGLAGFGAVNFSGNIRSIGKVGETPIEVTRYSRQLSQDLASMRQRTSATFGMAEMTALGLDRATLARVVSQVALEDEARRIGLSIGDEAVRRQLLQLNDFKDFAGNFDTKVYREALNQVGESVTSFERQLRAEEARTLLQGAVIAGVTMPDAFTDTLMAWAGERRTFTWVLLSQFDRPSFVVEPSEEQIAAWYQANPARYTRPEIRKITYAWITPSMMVETIEVPEADLQALYNARIDQYRQPERRLVERLAYPDYQEALLARARWDEDEMDFEMLVAERNLTLDDVDMGDVTQAELGAAGPRVFAMVEPGVEGPFPDDTFPSLYRMNGVIAAQEVPFEEAREELRNEIASDRARRMIRDMREEIDDLLAGGAIIEELASDTALELGQIDYSTTTSDGIAGYGAFRTAATQVRRNDFADAIELDDGGMFALRLDDIVPPQLEPLESVRARVIQDWKDAEMRRALAQFADDLLPRMQAGEDLSTLGVTVRTETAVMRDAFLPEAPAGLVEAVFGLTQPGMVTRVEGQAGTALIALARLDEVLPPDPENPDLVATAETLRQQMDQNLGADLLEAFTRAVEAQARISLDQAAVNAVNAQFQ